MGGEKECFYFFFLIEPVLIFFFFFDKHLQSLDSHWEGPGISSVRCLGESEGKRLGWGRSQSPSSCREEV